MALHIKNLGILTATFNQLNQEKNTTKKFFHQVAGSVRLGWSQQQALIFLTHIFNLKNIFVGVLHCNIYIKIEKAL